MNKNLRKADGFRQSENYLVHAIQTLLPLAIEDASVYDILQRIAPLCAVLKDKSDSHLEKAKNTQEMIDREVGSGI